MFGHRTQQYPNLREVVETTIRHREGLGYVARPGLLEDAVREAEKVYPMGTNAVIDRLEELFKDGMTSVALSRAERELDQAADSYLALQSIWPKGK